ncbi:hypothetical protein ACQKMD_09390 [Viridibacillus sp. NPDC096237]|uniref:hypothetical protein n=1 Tax=Viridibacillus sp. NPDC096237 TaxID=3390721 RepID=UPI003D0811A0
MYEFLAAWKHLKNKFGEIASVSKEEPVIDAILDEAIKRLKSEVGNNETRIMEFNERRTKALALKYK